jgi:hypothetical protein
MYPIISGLVISNNRSLLIAAWLEYAKLSCFAASLAGLSTLTAISFSQFILINSMTWVRERAIPTERPPLVGEHSTNVCG